MKLGEHELINITNEEKQLIYDAMVHYAFSESEIGRSKHFDSDIHREIGKQATKMAVEMVDAWNEVIIP